MRLGKYIVLLKIDLVSHPACAEGLGKYIVLLKIDLVTQPAGAGGGKIYILLLSQATLLVKI